MVSNDFCDTVAHMSAGRCLHAVIPQIFYGDVTSPCAVLCACHAAHCNDNVSTQFSVAACKE